MDQNQYSDELKSNVTENDNLSNNTFVKNNGYINEDDIDINDSDIIDDDDIIEDLNVGNDVTDEKNDMEIGIDNDEDEDNDVNDDIDDDDDVGDIDVADIDDVDDEDNYSDLDTDTITKNEDEYSDECIYDFTMVDESFTNDKSNQNENKFVLSENRITKPILFYNELVRLVSDRMTQLQLGAKPMIENYEIFNPEEIASKEIEYGTIPMCIIRSLPSGKFEKWWVWELKR